MIKSLAPNMMTDDVNVSVDYYREVFGAEVIMSVPETGKLVWAMMKMGDVTIQFQDAANLKGGYPVLTNQKAGKGGGLTLFIDLDNVEELYQKVKANKKANIIKDLNKTFYGATEFAVEDLNGFVITFSENN